MTLRLREVILIGSLLLTPATSSATASPSAENLNVEDLFRHSADAYRSAPALEITFRTSAEFRDSDPGERVVRYLIGEDSDVSISPPST